MLQNAEQFLLLGEEHRVEVLDVIKRVAVVPAGKFELAGIL